MSLGMKITETQKREYRAQGFWGDDTLLDYWNRSFLNYPQQIAVVDLQGTQLTFAKVNDAAGRVASFLQETGVRAGDFVSVQLPGWSEFMIIYVACLKVGAVINPILPSLREDELEYILNKCETKVLFIPASFKNFDYPSMLKVLAPKIPSLKQVIRVDKDFLANEEQSLNNILRFYTPLREKCHYGADDLAAVLFTSGTEGRPKGVMLTHNNIISSELAYANRFQLTSQDSIFMPGPVAHATGFHHGITVTALTGAKCVLQDIYKPDTCLALIERERCTCGNGATPIIYDLIQALQDNPYDISSLRFFLCGGSPVPRHMVKQAMDAGFKVFGVYGSTESVPHAASRLDDSDELIINTDGIAFDGIEIKVVDVNRQMVTSGVEGEEASRGPNVFVGYLKEPELTNRVLDNDGWYFSGDLCRMDQNGYIRITGRKKDIIIRGGENISSNEVEHILLQHPNVSEAGVVGMPDSRLGERTCAFVVLKDFAKGLTLEEVREFFASMNVAIYKYPERIEIRESLPITEAYKIKKYILREEIKNLLMQPATV
jgi:acyl-CoA synthetase